MPESPEITRMHVEPEDAIARFPEVPGVTLLGAIRQSSKEGSLG